MTYKIPGYEHLSIYANHGISINHDHKVTLTQIMKNASTNMRSIIDLPDYYNFNTIACQGDRSIYKIEDRDGAMEFCRRDDYVNLIVIREPASRLASCIAHDVLTYENSSTLPKKNSILQNHNIITRSGIFLREFSTFDLARYLQEEQPEGDVIPGPNDCYYHGRIQFNDTVTELIQFPNTFVFHLDLDLSPNLMYFFKTHRPDAYEQYMARWTQAEYKHSGGEADSIDQIEYTANRSMVNNRYSNNTEYIYYTILPYLTDTRLRPNKIFDDYQKFYARDIEMYNGMDPNRYFRRPQD